MATMHNVEVDNLKINSKIKKLTIKVTSTLEDGSVDVREFMGLGAAIFVVPMWTKIGPCGEKSCPHEHAHASAVEHATFGAAFTTLDLLTKIPTVAHQALESAFKLFTGKSFDGSKSDE